MKKLIALFLLLALPVMAADPVPAYWWRMTSADTTNVVDWSSGSNAVYMPSVGSGPVLNTTNTSSYFYFDGVGQALRADKLDFGGLTNWMASLWVYVVANKGQCIIFNDSAGGGPGYRFDLSDQSPYFSIRTGYVQYPASVPLTEWVHLSFIFTGDTTDMSHNLLCYLNGVQLTPVFSSGSPLSVMETAEYPAVIGSYVGGGATFLGYIDDVRIYTNGVSATTPATLYAAGRTPDSSAPTPVAKPFMLPMRMKNGSVTAIHRRAGTNAPAGWSDTNVYAALYTAWNTNTSGSFLDESANANVAAVNGANVARYDDGAGHYMITNSGVGSSYLGIPAVTAFVISNDYTVTLWVKLNAYGARVDLFTFSSATGNGDMGLRLLEPSGAKLRFFTASAAEANYDLYDTTTTIADHNWHQLVMTWTRATRTVKFYIDAVENGQATTQGGSTPLGVATGPLNISGSGIGTTPINGLMDYFGVMQYALSASGVTNLYQNTHPTGVP